MTKKAELNISKTETPFSIESEIAKIKISIPFTELVTEDVYRSQLLKALNIGDHNDSVNLNDDQKLKENFKKVELLHFMLA